MTYLIVTLINFLIVYFCCHFILWNVNYNKYWHKEKEFKRFSPPIWVWIIIIILSLSYWGGLICALIMLSAFVAGVCIDEDVMFDPKLSNWFKRTWLGRFLSYMYKILTKKVSI